MAGKGKIRSELKSEKKRKDQSERAGKKGEVATDRTRQSVELIEAIPRQFGMVCGRATCTYRVCVCVFGCERRGRNTWNSEIGIKKLGAHAQPTRVPHY